MFYWLGFFYWFSIWLALRIPKKSNIMSIKKVWVHWPITHSKSIKKIIDLFFSWFLACAKNSQVNSKKKMISKYVYFSSDESSGSRYQRRRGPIEISALLKNLTNWIVQTRDLRNADWPILLRKLSLVIQ